MLSKRSIKINKTYYEVISVNIQTRMDFRLTKVHPLIDISLTVDKSLFEYFKKIQFESNQNIKFELCYDNIIAEGCLISEIIYNLYDLLEVKIENDCWKYLNISDIRNDKLKGLGI